MDRHTLQSYDTHGRRYAEKWLSQTMPAETQTAVRAAFRPNERTVDVGCGSGRDVRWLVDAGVPTQGIEASQTMLDVARAAFPDLTFSQDALPTLPLTSGTFTQVLCRNVLMHLDPSQQGEAVERLLRLLEPQGVLLLTWRTDTAAGVARDKDGRLYAHVEPETVEAAVRTAGGQVRSRDTAQSGASGRALAVWVIDAGR
ncbi:MAG: class I SAM-dependent methyltransferase [Myxococcales bacterium]|nr:class I SAM-dependent methyltransferase [Myxococcales bacterium]